MRTPIEGARGIGYVLRKGYDLPPINLDTEEAEAITIGLSLIARTGDQGLIRAAKRAARKLHSVAPLENHLIASSWGGEPTNHVDMSALRHAIRDEHVLTLSYHDASARHSTRTIWPLALIYYIDHATLVAWCTLRQDFRHFRLDRTASLSPTGQTFQSRGDALRQTWEATLKDQTVTTR